MRTTVALGSNLGDRLDNLRQAVARLHGIADSEAMFLTSRVYATEPIDCPPDSPAFLNAVVEFEFNRPPLQLLAELQKIETAMERPSDLVRNAPRLIDLDILHFGEIALESEQLTLPHPRLHLRRFVLAPMADIVPDLCLQGQFTSIAKLLTMVEDTTHVVATSDRL